MNVFAGWIGRESWILQRRGYGRDVACDDEKERAEVVLRKHAAGARQRCQGSGRNRVSLGSWVWRPGTALPTPVNELSPDWT